MHSRTAQPESLSKAHRSPFQVIMSTKRMKILRQPCLSDMGVGLIIKPSVSLQPETSHTARLICSLYQFCYFYFPVSQRCMRFPFLLLVCKFTCSQNSSPERLLLCLKCKICTPTRQLHELAVAIINSSEGQQTFAINGE